ncbi:hypothetical protein BD408DRAFT_430875 [Parasitella parasitica]|nr:hypothetical protein BD408DRAFT_430875 [Parasitella parasitica]
MHSEWQETSGYESREKTTKDMKWIAKQLGTNPENYAPDENKNVTWEQKVAEETFKKNRQREMEKAAKEGRPFDVKNVSRLGIVDIQKTKFKDLPSDWQKENLESAENIVYLVLTYEKEFDFTKPVDPNSAKNLDIEKLANMVHEAWMSRNEITDWSVNQHKPYDELSAVDKYKDKDCIRVAFKLLAEKGIPDTCALRSILN